MPHWFIDSSNSVRDDTSGGGQGYAFGLGTSDSLYILNTGYIVETAANSDGLRVTDTAMNCQVHIDGLIAGTRYGIQNFGLRTFIEISGRVIGGSVGIWDKGGASIAIDSSGTIQGEQALVLGLGSSLLNNGTIINTGTDSAEVNGGSVTNNGLISSMNAEAFSFKGGSAQNFQNTGTIQGGISTPDPTTSRISIDNSGLWTGNFVLTDGADRVINSGRVDGNIYLNGGGDALTNTGRINGSVNLGDGDNQLDSRYGIITGAIICGNGKDSIQAGAGDDIIRPGAGADNVDGGAGVNTIDYGTSAKAVKVNLLNGIAQGGDAQGDHLLHIQNVTGSAFDDILIGDDGDNTLYGVLGRDRIHALIAGRWMKGWSLPRIIQAQIDRNPQTNVRTTIRNTLELIENQVRFQVARMFGCYTNLLVYALDQAGHLDLVESIPGLPLFLEVGASDQTMISFMSSWSVPRNRDEAERGGLGQEHGRRCGPEMAGEPAHRKPGHLSAPSSRGRSGPFGARR
ncbi:hypothetical protein [Aestuariivirga sp.]|uniref:hypothetical protein n=1 Tax=Aestuariivirga sp. TaxID=2650926 RepID=UPI0039E358D8